MTDEEVKHWKFDFSWITLLHTVDKQTQDFAFCMLELLFCEVHLMGRPYIKSNNRFEKKN